jgi:hypothetical protein
VARLDDLTLTTPPWKAVDAIDAMNRSPHLVLYNGHGDTDKIMRLSTGDLNALTNQDLFLAYSVGCNAGQFDNDRFSPDSIGEELVKRPRFGAFAAVFNSRAGWYEARREERYSGEFQTKFFQQLLKKGQTRLGTACQVAKHEMLGHIEASGIMPYRWCYYEIILFGDPHVSLKLPGAASQAETTLRMGDAASPASPPRRAYGGGADGPSRTAE